VISRRPIGAKVLAEAGTQAGMMCGARQKGDGDNRARVRGNTPLTRWMRARCGPRDAARIRFGGSQHAARERPVDPRR